MAAEGVAACCTCAGTRAAGSVCSTSSSAYAAAGRGVWTPWTPRPSSGLPVDAREYSCRGRDPAPISGCAVVRLLHQQPAEGRDAAPRTGHRRSTAVEPLTTTPTSTANAGYLRTKRDRMGHTLLIDNDLTGSWNEPQARLTA
ncbi:MAG: hypothetical protein WKG07_00120 [Hymenobacter sp.]